MRFDGRMIAAGLAALLLAGCSQGARQVDYSPQRAFSSDIANSLNRGPTAAKPGMQGAQEPLGALPWQIPDSRQ
jgi:hypothetical protein